MKLPICARLGIRIGSRSSPLQGLPGGKNRARPAQKRSLASCRLGAGTPTTVLPHRDVWTSGSAPRRC